MQYVNANKLLILIFGFDFFTQKTSLMIENDYDNYDCSFSKSYESRIDFQDQNL